MLFFSLTLFFSNGILKVPSKVNNSLKLCTFFILIKTHALFSRALF